MSDADASPLPLRQIAAEVFVAPQLDVDAMAAAARLGIRSVINNRPDYEEGPQQPTNASVEAAARAAGLEYRFLPVNGAWQSPQEIAACRDLLDELPRPLLMFCRSGARSTRLYMAAQEL